MGNFLKCNFIIDANGNYKLDNTTLFSAITDEAAINKLEKISIDSEDSTPLITDAATLKKDNLQVIYLKTEKDYIEQLASFSLSLVDLEAGNENLENALYRLSTNTSRTENSKLSPPTLTYKNDLNNDEESYAPIDSNNLANHYMITFNPQTMNKANFNFFKFNLTTKDVLNDDITLNNSDIFYLIERYSEGMADPNDANKDDFTMLTDDGLSYDYSKNNDGAVQNIKYRISYYTKKEGFPESDIGHIEINTCSNIFYMGNKASSATSTNCKGNKENPLDTFCPFQISDTINGSSIIYGMDLFKYITDYTFFVVNTTETNPLTTPGTQAYISLPGKQEQKCNSVTLTTEPSTSTNTKAYIKFGCPLAIGGEGQAVNNEIQYDFSAKNIVFSAPNTNTNGSSNFWFKFTTDKLKKSFEFENCDFVSTRSSTDPIYFFHYNGNTPTDNLNLSFINCDFSSTPASGDSKDCAVYLSNTPTTNLTLTKCNFTGIKGSNLIYRTAYNKKDAIITASNCTIDSCSNICVKVSKLKLTNCTIKNCIGGVEDPENAFFGAVYASNSIVDASDSTFENNVTTLTSVENTNANVYGGGAIFLFTSTLYASSCNFYGNGIFLTNNTISSANYPKDSGGGAIYISYNSKAYFSGETNFGKDPSSDTSNTGHNFFKFYSTSLGSGGSELPLARGGAIYNKGVLYIGYDKDDNEDSTSNTYFYKNITVIKHKNTADDAVKTDGSASSGSAIFTDENGNARIFNATFMPVGGSTCNFNKAGTQCLFKKCTFSKNTDNAHNLNCNILSNNSIELNIDECTFSGGCATAIRCGYNAATYIYGNCNFSEYTNRAIFCSSMQNGAKLVFGKDALAYQTYTSKDYVITFTDNVGNDETNHVGGAIYSCVPLECYPNGKQTNKIKFSGNTFYDPNSPETPYRDIHYLYYSASSNNLLLENIEANAILIEPPPGILVSNDTPKNLSIKNCTLTRPNSGTMPSQGGLSITTLIDLANNSTANCNISNLTFVNFLNNPTWWFRNGVVTTSGSSTLASYDTSAGAIIKGNGVYNTTENNKVLNITSDNFKSSDWWSTNW